jgi:hypothetical protein
MERGFGLFESDAIAPDQFYANFRQGSPAYAERRLMMAVLQDALDCFRKHAFSQDQRSRQIFRDAQDWIFAADRQWCYSFENICDALGLDPDYVRRGLERWYREAQQNPGKAILPQFPRRSPRSR